MALHSKETGRKLILMRVNKFKRQFLPCYIQLVRLSWHSLPLWNNAKNKNGFTEEKLSENDGLYIISAHIPDRHSSSFLRDFFISVF